MLRRLLIANRGEIACRIAATAQRLGVAALAVYSEADRTARHVRVADEAYLLGPAPAAQSYLDIERILDAARRAGADAIHPGYGFLSENAAFAQACVDAGFIFVGPPAASIRAMGSKSAAKSAMAAAGVPVAPGYHGEDQSMDCLGREARRVGFPLIVKASAGGGGKGMQVVESLDELAPAVESAQRIARASFGDERLLLERYFATARHVEVQIFADAHGAARALFDRDCSVQRRHQKVVEEAPAPGVRPEVRAAMAEAALTVARAVGYRGAGTVEFLMDAEQGFYFMEMNTRLQVEHPVTELIAGIDLVEWQLRAASGERLEDFADTARARGAAIPQAYGAVAPHARDTAMPDAGAAMPRAQSAAVPRPCGAAVEVRLYAEDPARDYLPSVGTIAHLHWPPARAGLRIDAGVDCGDAVSPFYDPMLGKLIAWGETREMAVDKLAAAVAQLEIVGVTTNRRLLAAILGDEDFRAGRVSTDFLSRRARYLSFDERGADDADLTAAALWCVQEGARNGDSPWSDTSGWWLGGAARSRWNFSGIEVEITRHDGAARHDGTARHGGAAHHGGAARQVGTARAGEVTHHDGLEPAREGGTGYTIRVGDRAWEARLDASAADALRFDMQRRSVAARIVKLSGDPHGRAYDLHVFCEGRHSVLRLARAEDSLDVSQSAAQGSLTTPLPGTVVAVFVTAGQAVQAGDPLITVEAMKMEHALKSPRAGKVSRVLFAVGDRVPEGAVLVELEESAQPS